MISNARTRTAASATTTQNAASKATVYATTGIAGAIGLWAGACFVSAVINAGPIGLIGSWFSAVAGL
jgi:hypothetical protein